jgi:hypothetical protein
MKYLRDLFDNPAKYMRFISLDEDRINKLLNLPMGESNSPSEINKWLNCPPSLSQSNFLDDDEKMADFEILTKKEFLTSYSYLTEQEYDNTMENEK